MNRASTPPIDASATLPPVWQCCICRRRAPRYLGKCPSCGTFNAFEDVTIVVESLDRHRRLPEPLPMPQQSYGGPFPPFGMLATSGMTGMPGAFGGPVGGPPRAMAMPVFTDEKITPQPRMRTGIDAVDRVLARGEDDDAQGPAIGSCILFAGDPGAGKSTLLTKICGNVTERGERALYMTREESREMVVQRAARMQLEPTDDLLLLADGSIENLIDHVRAYRPRLVVVDSLQVCQTSQVHGQAGSTRQVTAITKTLFELAHDLGDLVIFLVCHITKNRSMAGPKVVEHWVDASLLLTLDPRTKIRTLSAMKNRNGWDSYRCHLAMTEDGMRPTTAPSMSSTKGSDEHKNDEKTSDT